MMKKKILASAMMATLLMGATGTAMAADKDLQVSMEMVPATLCVAAEQLDNNTDLVKMEKIQLVGLEGGQKIEAAVMTDAKVMPLTDIKVIELEAGGTIQAVKLVPSTMSQQ